MVSTPREYNYTDIANWLRELAITVANAKDESKTEFRVVFNASDNYPMRYTLVVKYYSGGLYAVALDAEGRECNPKYIGSETSWDYHDIKDIIRRLVTAARTLCVSSAGPPPKTRAEMNWAEGQCDDIQKLSGTKFKVTAIADTGDTYRVEIQNPRRTQFSCARDVGRPTGHGQVSNAYRIVFATRIEVYDSEPKFNAAVQSFLRLMPKFPPWFNTVANALKLQDAEMQFDRRQEDTFWFDLRISSAGATHLKSVSVRYTDATTVQIQQRYSERITNFTFPSEAADDGSANDVTTAIARCIVADEPAPMPRIFDSMMPEPSPPLYNTTRSTISRCNTTQTLGLMSRLVDALEEKRGL